MDIQSRVVNYYKSNQFIQKYLKGIDSKTNELVLSFNNEDRRISIDSLESIKNEEDLVSLLNGNVINQPTVEPAIEVPVENTVNNSVMQAEVAAPVEIPSVEAPAPVQEGPVTPVPQEQVMLTATEDLSRESLNDIKILTELKNKEGLNNLLKKYAVNPSTGLIDLNQAINIITENTKAEVINAIKNNYEFDDVLTNFEVDGRYIGTPISSYSSDDEKIVKSFGNIRILLEASRMYPEQVNYTDEQIGNYMNKYINDVKQEISGGSAPANPEPAQAPAPQVSEPTAPATASAGFADIFVLTVIVLVYAVIIVNLILRLK